MSIEAYIVIGLAVTVILRLFDDRKWTLSGYIICTAIWPGMAFIVLIALLSEIEI